jgi:hypothetical protein
MRRRVRRILGTSAAGYDTVHQRRRDWWKPRVLTGTVVCAHCPDVIAVGEAWDLAHSDDRRTSSPAHARCNRREAGLKTARQQWALTGRRVSREW